MPRAARRVVTAAVERGVASAGIAAVRALDRDVIGQGHHPRGAAGSVTGWVFAHRPSNRQRNGWVVSLLDVQPAEPVNGQVFVPAGGQVKVSTPRVDQVLFRVVPPLALASRMR